MSEATTERLLNTTEAADALGISRRKLYNLIASRDIATIRIPNDEGGQGEHRIEPAEIRAFIKRHRSAVTP